MVSIWIPLLLTVFAGLSTGIGSLIALFIKDLDTRQLIFFLGFSAGVMIYVSFAELLASAIIHVNFLYANIAFFGGMIFIMAIDMLVPHDYISEKVKVDKKHKKVMMIGVFTALGIAIHNFPEGAAVFLGSMSNLSVGIPLAIAIAIHNIPEGIAISMPIFYATKSHRKAFAWSLLSGIAEPVGAIIAYLLLLPILNPTIMALSLAFVGGIMVFISFDELLPFCYENGKAHTAIIGLMLGMFIMALSLHII